MSLSVRVGDEITGSYETIGKNIVVHGEVTSCRGDYVYIVFKGERVAIHRKTITKVNGERV